MSRDQAVVIGELPARIGARYDVVDRLGRGGMAVVYRVRDRSSPDELALKQLMLPGSSRDRETRELFEREFKVLAQLRHPGVVAVRDYGVDASGPYYTMELLDGGDLSTRAPWAVADACHALMQVCSLLSLLHARGFVHRDVTPRNVRLAPDGSVKLIDFGAMVPMGPCLQGVGTPGFVAPEVVQHLPLDARTDLFSVGATLYFALTGERPFPARSLAELSETWRREPRPPSELTAGIPAQLDALIGALLQIDPARRPNSAFEVMQRLAAISGTRLADSADLSRAYLSTPKLIGGEEATRSFRHVLQRAIRDEGGSLLFAGAPGSGRSRLLAVCALEAQTAGATVLRAGGRAARVEPLYCAHLLSQQLMVAMPDEARELAAHVGAAQLLAAEGLRPASDWARDVPAAQAALAAWWKRAACSRATVIAVDDLELIDAASLALLVGLVSDAADARLFVLGALQTPLDLEVHPALAVLRSYSTWHEIEPLRRDQFDELFLSIFGGAPRANLVSDRIHRLTGGNPRDALALVQHMLDRQLLRYADGNWILPLEPASADLPASSQEALRMRLNNLQPDARWLARAQALALEAPFQRTEYAALLGGDAQRAAAALEALLHQGLVIEDAGSYALAQLDVRTCLTAELTDAERSQTHRALAAFCTSTGRTGFSAAYHWLWSDTPERGLEVILQLMASTEQALEPRTLAGMDPQIVATTLERACDLATAARRPVRERCELARTLLLHCVQVVDDGPFQRQAGLLLQQLQRDSGLDDYRALHELADPRVRLQRALQTAGERHAATPEAQRGYRVDEAIKHMVHYVVIAIVIGNRTRDTLLVASLPGLLEPFAPLSPALHALWQNAICMTEMHYRARFEQARARAIEVYRGLEHVSTRDVPNVDVILRAVAYAAAAMEASLGYPSAEAWIALVENDPLHRVSAQQLRRQLSAYDGDIETAERYRKRGELLAVQANSRQMFESAAVSELFVQIHLGDVAGMKHAADRLALVAVRWPHWRPVAELALGNFHRLRGDLNAAHAAFTRTIALYDADPEGRPAVERVRLAATEGCMMVLVELGRLEEARELGLALVRRCERLEITGAPGYLRTLAVIEAKLGDHERAAQRVDALLVQHAGRRPSRLALDYHARALVAIHAGDALTASEFAQLALEHSPAQGPHGKLAVRFHLLNEAQRTGLQLDLPAATSPPVLDNAAVANDAALVSPALAAELAVTREPSARTQRALELLCEALQSPVGRLYAAQPHGLVCIASLGAPDDALERFAQGYWQQRQRQAAMTTVFTAPEPASVLTAGSWISPSGDTYAILPLSPGSEAKCMGFAVLLGSPGAVSAEYWALSAAISVRLQELGDLPASPER